jgi:hypothetical protein
VIATPATRATSVPQRYEREPAHRSDRDGRSRDRDRASRRDPAEQADPNDVAGASGEKRVRERADAVPRDRAADADARREQRMPAPGAADQRHGEARSGDRQLECELHLLRSSAPGAAS